MSDSMLSSPPIGSDRRRLARQMARAVGTFENILLARVPRCVSVAAADGWMAVHVHERLDAVERALAATDGGRRRVEAFHLALFENSLDLLRAHVLRATGVALQGAAAHVDADTGTIVKTLSTHAAVDLVLLGSALPGLGVAVDDHLHASHTDGSGSVLR